MIDVVILFDVVFNAKRLWIQTGIKINRNPWDVKSHRKKSSATNSIEIDALLQNKVQEVEKIILDAQLNGIELSVAFIRNSLNKIKTSSNKTFWEYYDEYIKNVEMKCALNTLKISKNLSTGLYTKYSLLYT